MCTAYGLAHLIANWKMFIVKKGLHLVKFIKHIFSYKYFVTYQVITVIFFHGQSQGLIYHIDCRRFNSKYFFSRI